MALEMDKSSTPQDRYQKEKMLFVIAKYKKEFVNEFKAACDYLGYTQSEVIKKAMYKTLEEMKMKKYSNLYALTTYKNDDARGIELLKELDKVLVDNEIIADKPVAEVAKSFVEHPCMSKLELADSYEELMHDYFRLNPNLISGDQVVYFYINDAESWDIVEYNQFYSFTKFVDDEIVKTVYLIK